ncbi:MAG TPA: hypothetical protein VHB46_05030 [Burkholderiales bacterium]|nr:hypothetical protein [Burkholderiales bacterium]
MRFIGLTFVMLAGCASTASDLSTHRPYATFSSTRPVADVTACVRDGINSMEWALCPRATANVRQNGDRSELTVEGERGVDALFEGQQKGDSSVYELRVSRQATLGFCSLDSLFKTIADGCM